MSESLLLLELPQFAGRFHAWSLGYLQPFIFVKQPTFKFICLDSGARVLNVAYSHVAYPMYSKLVFLVLFELTNC
jgi:hypothetical protein